MPFILWGIVGVISLALLLSIATDHLNESTEEEAFEYLNKIRKTKRELYEKLCAKKDSLPENAKRNLEAYLLEYKGTKN